MASAVPEMGLDPQHWLPLCQQKTATSPIFPGFLHHSNATTILTSAGAGNLQGNMTAASGVLEDEGLT